MDPNTVDITEMLRRGGRMLYEGPDGRIALHPDGLVASDLESGTNLCGVLSFMMTVVPKDVHFCLKSQAAADAVQERFQLHGQTPCSQWVYTKETAPDWGDADIRLLTEEEVPLAAPYYHDSVDYLRERQKAGELWGLFEGGKLAAFMGLHEDGSMGILATLPEYRRKGYAALLESYVIHQQLQKGRIPYGHVIDGNEASDALQRRLGLVKAEKPAIWVF